MFDSLDISSSALTAQRIRMNTTHDAAGKPNPYRRRFAVFAPGQPDNHNAPGVHVEQIKLDDSAFRKVHDPTNVDADKDGNVSFPNIDLSIEYVNMLEASRAYEANVTTMEVNKSMLNAALRLIA